MAKRKRMAPHLVELEEGYYLTNFNKVLDFVQEVYSDILQNEEVLFLKKFNRCTENAQRLFVRLSLRSKAFYRHSKLNYPEMDIEKAATELQDNGLFEFNPALEFEDLVTAFTVTELKSFLKDVGKKGGKGNREDIINELTPLEDPFNDWVIKNEVLYWPLFSETIEKFKLLFFGNLNTDMAQFILEDVGVMRFEKIVIDKKNRYFEGRDHLDSHYDWIIWHSHLWEACYEKDLGAAESIFKEIKKIPLESSPMKRRMSRSHNLIAKLYEGEGEYKKALKLYLASSLEPARERATRIYEKTDQLKKALSLCDDILLQPVSESERYFAVFFKEKLKRKLGLPYEKRKKLPTQQEVILPLKWNKEGRVEEQVLTHLMQDGFSGFYSENNYWTTLTGLLFWEEYWSPGPGLFYHPFEQCPRDFYSGGLYQRQKQKIKNKIKYWEDHPEWEREVGELYDDKEDIACRLTHWKRTNKKNMITLCKVVPKDHIFKICVQILMDPRQYSSGLPDLFLYVKKKDYILGEVKSPNDTIQTSQKRWIDKFHEWGIPFNIYRLKS